MPQIFDSELSRYADVFLAVLMVEDSETLLPELFSIFGAEKFVKMIDIFGGSTITIPSREKVERTLRDISVYMSIRRGKSSYAEQAEIHGIDANTVNEIYHRMKALVEDTLNLSVS